MVDFKKEKDWIRIGPLTGRRSLWLRVKCNNDAYDNIDYFELRAGREGDDAYVQIGKSNPQFQPLLDVFLTAQFAVDSCNRRRK